MNEIARLIADARLALEPVEMTGGREDSRAHAISSAEWLEQTARKLRDELAKTEVTP